MRTSERRWRGAGAGPGGGATAATVTATAATAATATATASRRYGVRGRPEATSDIISHTHLQTSSKLCRGSSLRRIPCTSALHTYLLLYLTDLQYHALSSKLS
eukprot:2596830-Pleurochrysis_carterae.AAC.1